MHVQTDLLYPVFCTLLPHQSWTALLFHVKYLKLSAWYVKAKVWLGICKQTKVEFARQPSWIERWLLLSCDILCCLIASLQWQWDACLVLWHQGHLEALREFIKVDDQRCYMWHFNKHAAEDPVAASPDFKLWATCSNLLSRHWPDGSPDFPLGSVEASCCHTS